MSVLKYKLKNLLEEWFEVTITSRNKLIGMTSVEERVFLTEIVRNKINEKGAIIDLGTWMGSTAGSLAEGLKTKNGFFDTDNGKIFSFDTFVWDDTMENTGFELYCEYKHGESFLPEVRKRLAKYLPAIELIKTDLTNPVWTGDEIKIMLVDAMKNEALCSGIANNFYPFLKEESIIVHQDFKHWYTPVIHIFQYRLRHYFEFYRDLPNSGSTAFRTLERIPKNEIIKAADFKNRSNDETDQAFEYSLSLIKGPFKAKVAAAHMMYYIFTGQADIAQTWKEYYLNEALGDDHDMVRAIEKLKSVKKHG